MLILGGSLNGIPLMGARFFISSPQVAPPPGGDNNKKITRGGPVFFSFLLAYKRPVAKQKTHNCGPPQAKKKYSVYNRKIIISAPQAKKITFLYLEPILSVSKQHPLSQIKLSNPGLN